ncbi:DJ-1/PfpI family protein [Neobacillus niacini]|uniref:DJ-1/PfpI family protein n=1 Tax=Neobacillus niacini TaxID=86668 RepID=UPI0021CAE4E5|nr:DJ-1/PfpI family protein [Neobacillus niacini]MCM3764411.1 DJ-1/PfpI family protein [Neobacillus niacini]
MNQQWKVGILLFEDVDVLDYAGPFEVFSLTVYEDDKIAPLLTKGLSNEEKPFIVNTISQTGELISSHNGLKIQPDFGFQSRDYEFDILIVPGGPLYAIKKCIENKELINWISNFYNAGGMVASVCSGSILLAEAGLLNGKKATTHFLALEYLKAMYPNTTVVSNVRYVDQGDLLTSAGVSAGIDMSLYLVSKLMGEKAAARTAATEEYPYEWRIKEHN